MKRFLLPLLCAALMVSLGGCDTWWNLIVAGITGKGYYQTGYTSIVNASGYLTKSSIDLSQLTTDSVIIYQTTNQRYYGKMSLVNPYSSGSITIIFETYDNSGNNYASNTALSVSNGQGISLESKSGSPTNGQGSNSDFVFTAPDLVPSNNAEFYLYSK